MRINVRLDDNLAYKLDYLVHAEGLNVSDVVKESINRYYDEIRTSQPARDVLERSSFIGCGEADAEFSASYKATFTASLQAKQGDR